MKVLPFLSAVACGFLGGLLPASAQNPDLSPASADDGPHDRPAVGKQREESPLYATQDSGTLDSRDAKPVDRESVLNLEVLRRSSPYSKTEFLLVSTNSEELLRQDLANLSATYRDITKADSSVDCSGPPLAIKQQIKLDPSRALEIVEKEVAANPQCSCEIVKAAILTTGEDPSLVSGIVVTAINAAPEQMRIISQCAIAVAPDSLAAIQAILAKLDPNGGESASSAKSAKSSKDVVAAATSEAEKPPDPLAQPLVYWIPPLPIVVAPVTNVNP